MEQCRHRVRNKAAETRQRCDQKGSGRVERQIPIRDIVYQLSAGG